MATGTSKKIIELKIDSRDFKRGVKDINKNLAQLNKNTKRTTQVMNTLKGVVGGALVTRALYGFQNALRESFNTMRDFERGISEINTLLPENAKLTDDVTKEFIKLSSAYGQDVTTQTRAYYDIVSAGVKGTAEQMKVLTVANEAALAGLVDTGTAADALTTVMNSYAASGITAAEASDILFNTVKEGKTTFGELAPNIGKVAATAASAGIKFSELGGAIATLTKSGLSTEIAITRIQAIITALIKPSAQAADEARKLGLEFNTTALKAKGFAGFMDSVRQATGGNIEVMAKLFPNVRALGGAVQIVTGDFEDFNRVQETSANAMGSTSTAADEMKKSFDFQLRQLTTEFNNLVLVILNDMIPAFKSAIKLLKQMLPLIQTVAKGASGIIAGFTSAFDTSELKTSITILADFSREHTNLTGRLKTLEAQTGTLYTANEKTRKQIKERLALLKPLIAREREIVKALQGGEKTIKKLGDAHIPLLTKTEELSEALKFNKLKVEDLNREKELLLLTGIKGLPQDDAKLTAINKEITETEKLVIANKNELKSLKELNTEKSKGIASGGSPAPSTTPDKSRLEKRSGLRSTEIKKLDAAWAAGKLSAEQYNERLKSINQSYKDLLPPVSDLQAGWKVFADETLNTNRQMVDTLLNGVRSIGDEMGKLATNGKADFESLGKSVIAQLIAIATQMLIVKAIGLFSGDDKDKGDSPVSKLTGDNGGGRGPSGENSIEKLTDQINSATNSTDKLGDSSEKMGKDMNKSFDSSSEAIEKFAADSTDSMGDFFKKLLLQLAKVFAAKLLIKALGGLFAKGGVISSGQQLTAYAKGGVVNSPTIFPMASGMGLMGEGGSPEAIMPLSRGKSGNLGVEASGMGGGGNANVTVNIVNNTGGEVTTTETEHEDGRTLEIVINKAVKSGIGNGSFDRDFQSNFGIARRGG